MPGFVGNMIVALLRCDSTYARTFPSRYSKIFYFFRSVAGAYLANPHTETHAPLSRIQKHAVSPNCVILPKGNHTFILAIIIS